MSVNGEAVRVGPVTDQADEPGWEVDPDDDWALAVVATVGRQLRLRREAAGLRVPEFAVAVGYGEDLVYKIESGKRIPRPEYLDTADDVLGAGGRLLQTPEYARALLSMRRPAYSAEEVERFIAARVARRSVFDRDPALGFILEEWTLRRPLGGREVLRAQLEHLLAVARLPTVELQVMPMDRQEHAGVDGGIAVLKFADGTAVGRSPAVAGGRAVSDLRQLRILELRYGIIRAQALTPRESIAFVEDLLGET
ncbi:helix-turn-helix domain-containing protein [Streptomyces albogriseolus]|uniref:helix-turn-helix domain-containing protein n=1 Tax=Streptomyces albogriseolus TaxID=1887 RepID=UPI003460707C